MHNICDCFHNDIIDQVKNNLLDDELILDVADFFKIFSDSTRLKIINALIDNELCVCDLANIIGSTPSATSHQLRVLKQSKLVKYKKIGKIVYYCLDDEHIKEIFEKGCEHINEI